MRIVRQLNPLPFKRSPLQKNKHNKTASPWNASRHDSRAFSFFIYFCCLYKQRPIHPHSSTLFHTFPMGIRGMIANLRVHSWQSEPFVLLPTCLFLLFLLISILFSSWLTHIFPLSFCSLHSLSHCAFIRLHLLKAFPFSLPTAPPSRENFFHFYIPMRFFMHFLPNWFPISYYCPSLFPTTRMIEDQKTHRHKLRTKIKRAFTSTSFSIT